MSEHHETGIKTKWLVAALVVVALLALPLLLSGGKKTPETPGVAVQEAETAGDALEDVTEAVSVATEAEEQEGEPLELAGTLKLTSSDVRLTRSRNPRLPLEYSCFRDNVSPPLVWSGKPDGTKAYVLLFERMNGKSVAHVGWVLAGIDARGGGISKDFGHTSGLKASGSVLARNDGDSFDYAGPCEREGMSNYRFRLFALDTKLSLPDNPTKQDVLDAMQGHIIDIAEFPVKHYYR